MNAQVPDSAMNPNEIRELPKLAAEYMGKSLLDLVVQEMRVMPDIWQKMSQAKQSETIERATHRIKYAVAGAVNTIATHGHTALTATVESIALKDKIKLTVLIDKGNVTESLHTLYESGSESRCQILLTSAEPYVGDMELVEAEPDQPGFVFKAPTPDEDMPWAISCPIDRGQTTNIVPAPNKILAMQYSEMIRNKLLESDSDFRHDLSKSVFACPWRESVGAHERSMQAGNWETLVNWASHLSASTDDTFFDDSPLLAISYIHADADVPPVENEIPTDGQGVTETVGNFEDWFTEVKAKIESMGLTHLATGDGSITDDNQDSWKGDWLDGLTPDQSILRGLGGQTQGAGPLSAAELVEAGLVDTEYSEEELNDPEFQAWFDELKIVASSSDLYVPEEGEYSFNDDNRAQWRAIFDEGLNPEHAVLRIDSGLPF